MSEMISKLNDLLDNKWSMYVRVNEDGEVVEREATRNIDAIPKNHIQYYEQLRQIPNIVFFFDIGLQLWYACRTDLVESYDFKPMNCVIN